MKTTQLKSLSVYFLLLFFSACGQTNPPKKMKLIAKKTVLTSGVFAGNYIASYANAAISAELTENNNAVKGFLYMDGVQNELKAISNRNTMAGKIKDKAKNLFYNFTANLKDNVLHFSITFPELNNQVVELLLTKQAYTTGGESNATITNGDSNITASETTNGSSSKPNSQINSRAKDSRLIGTWRYTEVLSSGGYGDYASMATDYFIQFKANGECLSWTGSTAGGSNSTTIEGNGNGEVTIEGWYTEDKTVIYYDLNTKEITGSRPFIADETRILFKGGSNTIYERIN